MRKELPMALSNRHIHLSSEHIEKLFGEGYELNKFKDLSQPGQYAAEEKVDIGGSRLVQVAYGWSDVSGLVAKSA